MNSLLGIPAFLSKDPVKLQEFFEKIAEFLAKLETTLESRGGQVESRGWKGRV